MNLNPLHLIENLFHAGAIPDKPDPRNFNWGKEIGDVSTPFNWENGYDVEADLATVLNDPTFKLFVDDQGTALCCGGEAVHKKGEVVAAFNNKKYVRKSGKFPYAQACVPGGGSAAQPLFKIYNTQGMGNEIDTPSYIGQNPPTEAFMEAVADITQTARQNAVSDKSAGYAAVAIDIDAVAQAIHDGKGVILGIYGINNGTWRTSFPLPAPDTANPQTDIWAHWVFAGKAKMINGVKYIGFLNSWGTSVGDQGWQWITEDYFTAKFGFFNIWTFIYETIQPGTDSLFTQTIRFGMSGGDVKHLQTLLKMTLCDGIFGNDTLLHVKQFQTQNGLVADGVVGPITQQALAKTS